MKKVMCACGKPIGCLLLCFIAHGAYADGYVTLTKSTSSSAGMSRACVRAPFHSLNSLWKC